MAIASSQHNALPPISPRHGQLFISIFTLTFGSPFGCVLHTLWDHGLHFNLVLTSFPVRLGKIPLIHCLERFFPPSVQPSRFGVALAIRLCIILFISSSPRSACVACTKYLENILDHLQQRDVAHIHSNTFLAILGYIPYSIYHVQLHDQMTS